MSKRAIVVWTVVVIAYLLYSVAVTDADQGAPIKERSATEKKRSTSETSAADAPVSEKKTKTEPAAENVKPASAPTSEKIVRVEKNLPAAAEKTPATAIPGENGDEAEDVLKVETAPPPVTIAPKTVLVQEPETLPETEQLPAEETVEPVSEKAALLKIKRIEAIEENTEVLVAKEPELKEPDSKPNVIIAAHKPAVKKDAASEAVPVVPDTEVEEPKSTDKLPVVPPESPTVVETAPTMKAEPQTLAAVTPPIAENVTPATIEATPAPDPVTPKETEEAIIIEAHLHHPTDEKTSPAVSEEEKGFDKIYEEPLQMAAVTPAIKTVEDGIETNTVKTETIPVSLAIVQQPEFTREPKAVMPETEQITVDAVVEKSAVTQNDPVAAEGKTTVKPVQEVTVADETNEQEPDPGITTVASSLAKEVEADAVTVVAAPVSTAVKAEAPTATVAVTETTLVPVAVTPDAAVAEKTVEVQTVSETVVAAAEPAVEKIVPAAVQQPTVPTKEATASALDVETVPAPEAVIIQEPKAKEPAREQTAIATAVEPAFEKDVEADAVTIVAAPVSTAVKAEAPTATVAVTETTLVPVAVTPDAAVAEKTIEVQTVSETVVAAAEPAVEKITSAAVQPTDDMAKKIPKPRTKEDEKEARKRYANYGNTSSSSTPKTVEKEELLLYQNAGYSVRGREGLLGLGHLRESKMSLNIGVESEQSSYGLGLDMVKMESGRLDPSNNTLYGSDGTIAINEPTDSEGGTAISLAYRYKQKNLTLSAMIGMTPSVNNGIAVAPLLNVEAAGHFDAVKTYGRFVQSSVTDSLLSSVGNKDIYTQQLWGRVIKQGLEAGVSFGDLYRIALELGYYPVIKGENTLENSEITATLAAAKSIDLPGIDDFHAGLLFVYDDYDFDSEHYTYGHGGYFSPQSYFSGGVLFDMTKRFSDKILFDARASAGYTAFKNDTVAKYPFETGSETYTADSTEFLSADTTVFLGIQLSDAALVMAGAGYRNNTAADEYFVNVTFSMYLQKHWMRREDFTSIDLFSNTAKQR